jgi:hypothetical protein
MAIVLASGWDPLVAIGTLLLACVTALLVLATFKLARQAEADVRAQWTPVLLVRDRVPRTGEVGIFYEDEKLSVVVENVGRGPALNTDVWLGDLPGGPAGAPEPPGALGSQRIGTSLGQGESRTYEWPGVSPPPTTYSGKLTYYDLSRAPWTTEFVIEYGKGGPALRFQDISGKSALTFPWWLSIFPPWPGNWIAQRRFDRFLNELEGQDPR